MKRFSARPNAFTLQDVQVFKVASIDTGSFFVVKPMAKHLLQLCRAQTRAQAPPLSLPHLFGFPGASLLLALAVLAAWMPAASARPFIQVQSNVYPNSRSSINFPPVVPFSNSIYSPAQTIVQPGFGSGLSVQIGTPNYYPSGVYPSGGYSSGYTTYGQPGYQQRGSVNNSVLINPTVINSPIRNSTLVNPTIVTTPYTPYYPTPYFNIQTTTTTTRPEPEVYIDPQYGVRYRSPSASAGQPVIIYPQNNLYPQVYP